MKKPYFMQEGYHKHYFETLEQAEKMAEKIWRKTGIIVGIFKRKNA